MSVEPTASSAESSFAHPALSITTGTNAVEPRSRSVNIVRIISSMAAALAALSLFLLGLPGDSMPIEVVYGAGVASVFMSALAANLSVSEP